MKIDQLDTLLLPQIALLIDNQIDMFLQEGEHKESFESNQMEYALWKMAKMYSEAPAEQKPEFLDAAQTGVDRMRELMNRVETQIKSEREKLTPTTE